MKDLQKTRKLVKTSFFIAVVTIAAVLAFPRELTGKEWQIYMNSYLITTMGLTVGGAAIGIFFGMVLQLLILSVVIAVFDNYWVAVIALGMNSAAYVEETVRSGIESIDKGQMEAARATGMPYRMAMNEIIMPQAVKNILPALVNEFINLFKETSIVGYISVVDITMNSKSLQAVYYSVKPILFTGVVYYVSVKLFSFIGKRLEMRLKEND